LANSDGEAAIDFWIVQSLNGISFGMLLFLLAAGLSLVFGLMRIVNLTHGSFYLLGAYIGFTIIERTGSFLVALLVVPLCIAVVGLLIHRLLLRHFHQAELAQVLLTFGLLFIFADLTLWQWGGYSQVLPKPAFLATSLTIGTIVYPAYRIFVIATGVVMALLCWLVLERTTLGSMVRAGVDDEEMVRGLGINTPRLFTTVFALGAFLAALSGVIGGPFVGAYPGADFEVLLLALVVVIIGGLGSLRGAFVGSLVVGLIDTFGRALVPELAMFTIFAPMVIILALRPRGLFGRA
jgi:branched-chain amino acid transport system permease protein